MNKKYLISMTLSLLVGTFGTALAADMADSSAPKPAVFDAAAVTITATVDSIDYKNRTVTLKTSDGNLTTMDVGPEAVRFNEIKKGDTVQIDYLESVGIMVQSPNATVDSAEGSTSAVVRNKGKKPSGVMVTTDVVTATVVKVNHKTRKATLKGPSGNTFDIDVAPDVKNLENVKKGDQVMVKYTRTLAIDVRKTSK